MYLYCTFCVPIEIVVCACLDTSGYIYLIARSPKELIHEGDVLQHCVGRMNYDQKFVREETLIFFVRNKETLPMLSNELQK